MKQNIKRIWLALCMTVCLFALAGCSAAAAEEEAIDPSILMSMQQGTQQYLDFFSNMTDEEMAQALASSAKNKDTVMESALQSWESVKGDLGALVSSETAVVSASDDGYTARINAVYEKRSMEFSLMVDSDMSVIQGISFTPEYSTGEKMTKAAMNTLMGMGIVFCVLIFISWLISCFKYISVFENKMKEKEAQKNAANAPAAPAPAAAPAPVQAAPVIEEVEETDDTELISVIATAIAASEGKTSANGLVVRSIKRVPDRNWK